MVTVTFVNHIGAAAPKPFVFAHYMPWFQFPQNAYHWPPESGTYYLPIIGYYSSQNETVMEWQLSLMQYAGIDGVIVDWYGTANQNDYPFAKETTDMLWSKIQTQFPDLQLAICYDFNSHASEQIFTDSMLYLKANYLDKPQYLKYSDGNPIMLVFPSYASDAALQTPDGMNAELSKLNLTNLYVYAEFRNPAFCFEGNGYNNLGVFNWVYPQAKSADRQTQIDQVRHDSDYFYATAGDATYRSEFYVGSVYHGFSDHYVSPGTGTTTPYNGIGFVDLDYAYLNITYAQTYDNNTSGNYPFLIQIPTWNDYTEGTMIEPNVASGGCARGCNDDTPVDPYHDLVTMYRLFVNESADVQQVQQAFEDYQTAKEKERYYL